MNGKQFAVGERIAPTEGLLVGAGTYQHNGQLYASCAGTLLIEQVRN